MRSFQFYFLWVVVTALTLASLPACSAKKDDPQAAAGMSWTADGISGSDPAPQVISSSTNIDIIGSTGTAPNNTTIHVGMPAQVGSYATNSTAGTADYSQRGRCQLPGRCWHGHR